MNHLVSPRIVPLWVLLLLPWTGSLHATAAPTGLNIIPTADVLGPGEFAVWVETIAGSTHPGGGGRTHVMTLMGLGGGTELGFDLYDLWGARDWGADIKWQFNPGGPGRPVLALGAYATGGADSSNAGYLVASMDFMDGGLQATVGVMREHAWHCLLGAQWTASAPLDLNAEWVTGPGGAVSLGVGRDLGSGYEVLLWGARANSRDDEDFVALTLSRQWSWR